MNSRRGMEIPEADDWQEVNDLLDALLDLKPDQRQARLRQLRANQPDRAHTLERLINAASDDTSLDDAVCQALRFLAREDPGPMPERLGCWTLIREIGRGGMARVFLAERDDHRFRQHAAIKLLHADLPSTSLRERFARERRILARLDDSRIVRLLDGGETESGGIWLAMDYVEGVPIDTHCREQNLDLEHRLDLFEQVVGAVEYAHRHLVIHRDIKPSNVLVTGDGQVRLLDFGIAKLLGDDPDDTSAQTLTRALTPRYASPEQRAGQPVSTASDIHQLGQLLFELVTGTAMPPECPRASGMLRTRLESEGIDSGSVRRQVRALRGDIDHIIARATATEPHHRYPSCERLLADLGYARSGWPITARADERWYRLQRFLRRHSLAAGMIGIGVATSLVYGVVALHQARAIETEAAKATAVRDFVIEIFRQADPGHTLGEDLPVGHILATGRDRIGETLGEQPAIRAELQLTLGELYRALGEYGQAQALLHDAIASAGAGGSRVGEFRARLALAQVLGGESQYAMAEKEARAALALASGSREQSLARAEIGYLMLKSGRPEAAEPLLRESLAQYRQLADGTIDPMELSRMQTYMAYTDLILGRTDVAERELIEARERFIEQVGPDHPEVQAVSYTLARISELRGDWDQAETEMRMVIETETRVLGAGHREVGVSRTRLAHILLAQGRLEEAAAEFTASRTILEESTQGPQFFLADNLKGQAELELTLGRPDRAQGFLQQAIDQFETLLEWPDWRLADVYRIEAALALANGDCRRARELMEYARDPMLARPEPYPSRWSAGWAELETAEATGCPAP